MRCPTCHSEQDQKHFFCVNCGRDLHHPDNKNQHVMLPDINFEGIIEQFITDIKKQAHTVELETLEKIQDRATKWAKTNMFILGLASSVLVLALSFFGYKKVTDLENMVATKSQAVETLIRDKSNEVETLVGETVQQTQKASQEATTSLQSALQIQKELEQFSIESIQQQQQQLTLLETQLKTSLRKSAGLSTQLTTERQNIQKLHHSFFSISLHIASNKNQLASSRAILTQSLTDEGFNLQRANVVEIGVNQSEVIYYSEIAQEQAEMIATIAQENLSLHNVPARLISMLERNPREILIKIKIP